MNKPNVFLAVMDAVRPDHLSCYGHTRRTTPNIDILAQEAVLFENAFSAAPWSPPSHASMFTGMYPSQHGVLGKNLYLDEEIPTVAEIFSSKGYKTLGICVNDWVSSKTGLDRGFDRFVSHAYMHRGYRGYIKRWAPRLSLDWILFCLETDIKFLMHNWSHEAEVFQEIKKWILNSQKRNKPFFIFVNYFDAHTPYVAPQPFQEKFQRVYNHKVDLEKISDAFNSRHGYPYIAKEIEVSEEEWDVLKSWYDGSIAYIDFFLGKLFDYLKERELYDDTFTVITSDHGESFGEHQLANHVFCLYDTLLHVPLVIRSPEPTSGGKKISNIVSNIDIFPTLLDILDMKSKSKISGVNLLPFENRIYHKYVFAEYGPPVADITALKRMSPNVESSLCNKYNKNLKCIRSDSFKYIITSDEKEELYNLEKDPDESRNVLAEFPEKAEELKSLLTSQLKARPFHKRVSAFDDEMKRRLQELGYF